MKNKKPLVNLVEAKELGINCWSYLRFLVEHEKEHSLKTERTEKEKEKARNIPNNFEKEINPY